MIVPPSHDPRIAFFDRLAETWDTSGPPIGQQVERLESLQDQVGLTAGMTVLEVGCGTGQLTGWLASRVAPGTVTAIDFSPEMIRRTRERHPRLRVQPWDICAGPLPGSRFDLAFCLHVLPHFRDLDAAFRNMALSLKPGGLLVILHLSGREHVNDIHRRIGGEVQDDLLPTAGELVARLREVGFVAEKAIDESDLFLVRARLFHAAGDPR